MEVGVAHAAGGIDRPDAQDVLNELRGSLFLEAAPPAPSREKANAEYRAAQRREMQAARREAPRQVQRARRARCTCLPAAPPRALAAPSGRERARSFERLTPWLDAAARGSVTRKSTSPPLGSLRVDPKLDLYRSPEIAAQYDERWRGRSGRARDARKRRAIESALTELAARAPLATALDVPCGTARFTGLLRSRGLAYLGVDASSEMLRRARAKAPGVRFALGDLAHLPLADRSVDVALCVRLLHLVRERERRVEFLRELARVARIGVIVDYRWTRSANAWLQRARAAASLRPRPPNVLSLPAIESELRDASLAPLRAIPVRRVPFASSKVVLAAAVH
jgi:SAM-dependent methyltransferase